MSPVSQPPTPAERDAAEPSGSPGVPGLPDPTAALLSAEGGAGAELRGLVPARRRASPSSCTAGPSAAVRRSRGGAPPSCG